MLWCECLGTESDSEQEPDQPPGLTRRPSKTPAAQRELPPLEVPFLTQTYICMIAFLIMMIMVMIIMVCIGGVG